MAQFIKRLILMMPGTMPEHPTMGVGISRFRYTESDEINIIEKEISKQLETFLPDYHVSSLEVTMNDADKTLYIRIVIEEELFVFQSDIQSGIFTLNNLQ